MIDQKQKPINKKSSNDKLHDDLNEKTQKKISKNDVEFATIYRMTLIK